MTRVGVFPRLPFEVFSFRFHESTKAWRLGWYRQRVLSQEWLTHQNPLPTAYFHPRQSYRMLIFFVCPFCGVNLPWKVPNVRVMISIKFGTVLTGGWRPVRRYTLQHRISSKERTRRLGEAKAFIDITLEPLFFSFIFLFEWQIRMMQKIGRWENRITHLPTHVLLRRWAFWKVSLDDMQWLWRMCTARVHTKSQLNQSTNVIWIPSETTNRFNRSFCLFPPRNSDFPFWAFFGGKPIFLSVDVCFLGQHGEVEKGK